MAAKLVLLKRETGICRSIKTADVLLYNHLQDRGGNMLYKTGYGD
jgi:hypothetical protein